MPYSTRVRDRRNLVDLLGLQVGLEPTSLFWADVGELVNFLRGTGITLVPAHCPLIDLTSGSETLRYRVRPSGRAVTRIWVVQLRAGSSPGARATVAAEGGSARTVVASTFSGDATGVIVLPVNAAKTSAETDITCVVTWAEGTVYIDSVAVYELPRVALTQDATDLGVDIGTLEPNRPIVDRDYESLGGIGVALAGADGRRGGLMSWWGNVLTLASGAGAASIFETGVPIVPPKVGIADTKRVCDWHVYARVTAGATTGRVRAVRADGTASAWVNFTSTTFGWVSGTHDFLCEDFTDPAGLPGGAYETVNFEIEVTAGAGSIEVRGANVIDGIW